MEMVILDCTTGTHACKQNYEQTREVPCLEQPSAGANVRVFDVFRAVHNGRTARTRNAIVVSFAQAAHSSHVSLLEVVCCKVAEALLCDHNSRLELKDVIHHLLDLLKKYQPLRYSNGWFVQQNVVLSTTLTSTVAFLRMQSEVERD